MAAEIKMDSSRVACFECGQKRYMMTVHMGYLYNNLAEAVPKVCSFKLCLHLHHFVSNLVADLI